MVKGVVQEVLHHCNIFSSGGQFSCSVPDFCPESTHPPRHRSTLYCLTLVPRGVKITRTLTTPTAPFHSGSKAKCILFLVVEVAQIIIAGIKLRYWVAGYYT